MPTPQITQRVVIPPNITQRIVIPAPTNNFGTVNIPRVEINTTPIRAPRPPIHIATGLIPQPPNIPIDGEQNVRSSRRLQEMGLPTGDIRPQMPTIPGFQPFLLPPIMGQRPHPAETGIFPERPVGNDYYNQPDPLPEEFAIEASPENTNFIQASIETARNLFPSFELYLQAAEDTEVL